MSVTLQSLRELRVLLDSYHPTPNNGYLSERLSEPTLRHTDEAPWDDARTTLLSKAGCSATDEMATSLRTGCPLNAPVNNDSVWSDIDLSGT